MTIKEIVQRLKTAMDDARGQESHFESWLTQNEGICDAIDALKELDKTEQEPCGGCGGSGWVTRDPDIGTDQECFVCGGSGAYPKEPEQEQQIETLKRCLFQMQEAAKDLVKQAKSLPSPQRTWVGLTDEELPPLAGDNGKYMELQQVRRFYKAIEAKLKEKNT